MNSLPGIITHIESQQDLSLVSIQVGEQIFKSIVIETPQTADYLQIDHPIQVLFKETEVIIAQDLNLPISLQNRLPCIIKKIEQGKLLSKLSLESSVGKLASIITSNAVKTLALKPQMTIIAMIKTNELMLSP